MKNGSYLVRRVWGFRVLVLFRASPKNSVLPRQADLGVQCYKQGMATLSML